jgi:hypothetical protein
MLWSRRCLWAPTLAAALLTGCTGAIDDAVPRPDRDAEDRESESGGGEPTATPAAGSGKASPPSPTGSQATMTGANTPTMGTSTACPTTPLDPGPAPLRRLTPVQYANTLRDLFGDVPNLDQAIGQVNEPSEFGLAQADVAPVELESYQKTAETVAVYVATTPAKLKAIAPCAMGTMPRDCARAFVQHFGARAYRSPLTDAADVDRHLTLYDAGAKTTHEHGIELVLRGMLQAPRFLYRVELGKDAAAGAVAVRLSGHEIATRLAYVLWDSAPDPTLEAAAEAGQLDTPEGVKTVAEGMLKDSRGSHALRRFLERWTQLSKLDTVVKDDTYFPQWKAGTLKASMRQQATLLFDDVLDRQGGTLRALLTSPSVFVNKDLGGYYGMTGTDTFARVETSDGRNSGVLTLPGVLSVLAKPAESSPIYRGKFVREALFCQQLPAPPPNVPKPPDVQPDVSTRERLNQHETDPACSGCHRLLDPIGFGFENFDAVGRYRTEDAGDVIDAHGALVSTRDADGTFNAVRELGERLAQSAEVEECMARQWFRFALGRFERDVDECTLQQLVAAFESAGSDLRALPIALATSDAFLTRHPPGDDEVQP